MRSCGLQAGVFEAGAGSFSERLERFLDLLQERAKLFVRTHGRCSLAHGVEVKRLPPSLGNEPCSLGVRKGVNSSDVGSVSVRIVRETLSSATWAVQAASWMESWRCWSHL